MRTFDSNINIIFTSEIQLFVIVYQYKTINQQDFFPISEEEDMGPNETFGYIYGGCFFSSEE